MGKRTYDERLPAPFRVREQLHRREKRIHIDMQQNSH
jgi:hypothetical protein